MRKSNLKLFVKLFIVLMIAYGCGLNKMVKKYEAVKYEVTPNVLETHGGKISVTVKGKIPEKYFNKKATVEFIPVLKYEGGETALKSLYIVGEKVKTNTTGSKNSNIVVITKKTGGSFSYTDVIEYKPVMNKSELLVNAKATLGKKSLSFGNRKLADGVIYTSERTEKDEELALAEHGYVKEKIISQKASIFFEVNKYNLNFKLPLNKNPENIKNLEMCMQLIKNGWKIKDVNVNAWASPEGEEQLNVGLSDNRSKSGNKYIREDLTKYLKELAKKKKEKFDPKKIDELLPTVNITAKGEDWDGFISNLNSSDVKDKEKILNLVNSQTNIQTKQKQINNMTVIYKEIADKILPPLRRAEITISFFEPRKTEEQLKTFATTSPDSLDNSELLYAATLIEDMNSKLAIYKATISKFPNDWRAYNNAAYIDIKLGNIDEAASYLEKANQLSPNNGEVSNNLGVLASWKKDFDGAKTLYETAQTKGINTSYNQGIIAIRKGEYGNAISLFGSITCRNNVALAQMLSGNINGATATLECNKNKNNLTYYLQAVAGARSSNTSLLYDNLKKACQDPVLKSQAKDDREFLKYSGNSEFKNSIQ